MAISNTDLDMDGSDAEVEEYDIFTGFRDDVLNQYDPQTIFNPRPEVVEAAARTGWDAEGTLQQGSGVLAIISEPQTGAMINMERLNQDLNVLVSTEPKGAAKPEAGDQPTAAQNGQKPTGAASAQPMETEESKPTNPNAEEVIEKGYFDMEDVPLPEELEQRLLQASAPMDLELRGRDLSWLVNGTVSSARVQLVFILAGRQEVWKHFGNENGSFPFSNLNFWPSNTRFQFECLAEEVPKSFMFEKCYLDERPYGVPPALMLQAVTTASASDGVNLERLETIGDSFLKMAVTVYLFTEYPDLHEGRLSFSRSKEVSNASLCRKGYARHILDIMETSKFDPNVSWLPPCYRSIAVFHADDWCRNDMDTEVGL